MDVQDRRWKTTAREVSALPSEAFFERWRALPSERRDSALRLRFRHQRGEFLRYVLPEVFAYDWNAFHEAVLSCEKHHWSEQREVERRLNLAPRGVGKSTLKKGDVAHSIAYGLRRFIVVIAATKEDSEGWAATLRSWFGVRTEGNARLHDLFGPFKLTGKTQRFTVETRWGKTTIWCASIKTSVQGANEETHRPDEVILDDWEDRKHVRSEAQRKQWQVKLNSEILKLRDRARGAVFEANVTVNHPDAISQRIREGKEPNRGWVVREFPALFSWPDRMDLWDRCRDIYLNLSLGDAVRRRSARAFYEVHRAAMDAGAQVLDEAAQPLFALFEMIWCEGLAAFLQEMLHQVRGLGDTIFDTRRFARCTVEHHPVHGTVIVNGRTGKRIPLSAMKKRVGRWDPSTGAPGGDFAAITVLLRDQDGYGYAVACWMAQGVPVSGQLAAAWRLAEAWGLKEISLESNGFQAVIDEVFKPEREKRKTLGQFWQLQLKLDPSSSNKEERISNLEPVLHGGILQLAADIAPTLLRQCDDFDGIPDSGHDDGPDSLEGAWARSGGTPPGMRQHGLSHEAVRARHAA